jgi:hypothetical protein
MKSGTNNKHLSPHSIVLEKTDLIYASGEEIPQHFM